MRRGSETVETWIDVQRIQSRVYMQIRNPTGSFLHGARKPLECMFGVPQRGVDNAEFVREDSLVSAQSLQVVHDAVHAHPIVQNGEHVSKTREHHGAVR